jgi:BA14K-like protein
MFTKTMIVLAAGPALSVASAALAASDQEGNRGGFREMGPGGFATQGINPAYHPDSAGKCQRAYPKSYDPTTMTFVGRDGRRHPCP